MTNLFLADIPQQPQNNYRYSDYVARCCQGRKVHDYHCYLDYLIPSIYVRCGTSEYFHTLLTRTRHQLLDQLGIWKGPRSVIAYPSWLKLLIIGTNLIIEDGLYNAASGEILKRSVDSRNWYQSCIHSNSTRWTNWPLLGLIYYPDV
jgi:hypothetical protein